MVVKNVERTRGRLRVIEGGRRARDSRSEFERLYRESYRTVYVYLRSMLLDPNLAEEVASEAFFKAARSFDRYDPSRAKFSTWVISIAHNCALTMLRKRGREVSLDASMEEGWEPSAGEDTHPGLEESDEQTATRLLSVLDEEDRQLIYLKYYENLKNKEIAERLGMNASTVGSRVHRAVERMRAVAGEKGSL